MSKLVERIKAAIQEVELGHAEYRPEYRDVVALLAHIERLEASRLSEILAHIERLEAQLADTGTTHFDGCHDRGPKHYWCALRKIERLEAALAAIKARLNGEFDHPALEKQGALGELRDDVERIIDSVDSGSNQRRWEAR